MHVHVAPNAADLEAQGISLDRQLPAQALLSHVTVDGFDLAIADMPVPEGVPQRGVALLVPGFTSAFSTFNPLLAPLAARGYRVIALSQRGQAGSQGPSERSGYELDRLAADLAELLDGLGIDEPVHLLGHSFGGVVSIEAILAAPEKFASLTLWNSGPFGLDAEYESSLAALAENGPLALWVNDRRSKGLAANLDDLDALNPAERYYYDRLIATETAQLVAALEHLRDQVDRTSALAALTKPVLVSHGALDDAWPIESQRKMAEQLGADYWVIAGAGHSAHNDRTHASAQLLATFWDEHATK